MNKLERSEVLFIPRRRLLVHVKEKGSEGQDVLHVYYGEKEIIFDEPELLPFGTKLLEVDRFRAEEAMTWSDGSPHDWDKVLGLLEALLDQEILKRAADAVEVPRPRAFPERLGKCPVDHAPRSFGAPRDQCPVMTQEAYGRPIDLGNLEAVVPVYRVAHPTMDRDGRQVGENNVMPRSLFLDLPTERRLCNYSGNRFQAEQPMNVTALRHMTKRWPELLSLTEQFREAFLARLPSSGSALRAGDAHLLTVSCLASVGYVMVRGENPVPNGELDAGLAAMFRLIDGVRLVTTELMREVVGAHGCDDAVTAKSVADYAERNGVYHGTHGVCAGPQALIDEYLHVLLDGGSAPIRVEPDLESRLGDLGAALDYGLHGQRIESIIRVFGCMQGLLHDRLRRAFEGHTPRTRLQELLDQPIDEEHFSLLRTTHPLLDAMALEVDVNRWLFARAGAGLPGEARDRSGTTDAWFALDRHAQAESQRELAAFLAPALPGDLPESLRAEVAAVAADVLALERRCLRAVGHEQSRLNERLRREPGRPLTGADLALYTRPRSGPPLESTLADALGLSITTDAASSVISHGGHTLHLNH